MPVDFIIKPIGEHTSYHQMEISYFLYKMYQNVDLRKYRLALPALYFSQFPIGSGGQVLRFQMFQGAQIISICWQMAYFVIVTEPTVQLQIIHRTKWWGYLNSLAQNFGNSIGNALK